MQTFSIMAAPAPQLLRDYLIYMSTIKGRSPRTVEAYYNDLRLFLRYLMATRSGTPLPTDDPNLESISFASISEEMILSARLSDAYSFLAYVQSVNQNNAKTRARKVSSLRGFYKYLQSKAGRLEENPMEQLEIPAQRKSLPKYLTLDESLHLLESIEGKDRERDYCIITILLNCGIRLSELVGIKLSDIRDDTLTVLGKGNKERMVYLNSACLNAIAEYLAVRPEPPKDADKPYLLVSSRTRAPLTSRRVEQIVETHLKAAGLGGRGYSPHKLRHTAATLMYQYGGVDIRVLKEILGHVNAEHPRDAACDVNAAGKIAVKLNAVEQNAAGNDRAAVGAVFRDDSVDQHSRPVGNDELFEIPPEAKLDAEFEIAPVQTALC